MAEKIGFGLLIIVAIIYILALITGMILAFPFGIIGLFLIGGIGILFWKVLQDRLNNEEDDYYSKNVDK